MAVLWFAGGLMLTVIGLVCSIGALLPRDHVATGSVLVPRTAEAIWPLLRDSAQIPTWRKLVTKVEVVEGPPGAPQCWVEHSGDALRLRLESSDEPRQFVMRIDDERLPFGGTWTVELTPEGGATRVRVTERGFVKLPPMRFVSYFLIGQKTALHGYLRDLSAHLGGPKEIDG